VAERKNRTLIEAARTMLADSLLPTTFWAEAVNTACYVQNRVLVTKPHNKTPYELLHGRPPSISFMRPFGCPVTILNTLDPLGKFDGKADEGFLVGYSINSKAFRVFNTRTRKVEENLHITFLENKPNVAGSGPDWLFDIDLLTNSMNYEPVTAGNQTNRNAGIKDNVDAVPTQQYILLPFFPDSPQSSEDAVADDAGKKITEEPANKGERNGQEKEGETSNKEGDQHVQDLRAELDKLLVQQKEGYANSTNRVSTVSPSVSAAGQSFVNDLPTDPLMPDLEDTTNLLNTGIFNDAFDDKDVGAEADLNNLETTMNKDERGIIVRNKAKLVAQGYTQEEGIDYDEERIEHQELTDNIPPTPHDSPISGGYTPRSDEGRPDLHELMAICTKLSDKVLDLEKETDAQAMEILKLKNIIKKLERKAKSSVPPPKRRLYKQVDSFDDSLGSGGTEVFDDTTAAEKDVNAAELVSTAGDAVTTDSVVPDIDTAGPLNVSAAGPSISTAGDIFKDEMMTIADTLMTIRSTRSRTTSVVIRDVKEEPRRATPVPTTQSQDKEVDNVQARIEADALLATRLQEEEREQFSIDEQARFLVETIAERKRFFAAQRAEQIRNKPPTKTQLRNKMITYLKNMESSKKEATSSKKRQKADPDDENVKRQKLEDTAEKEGLKAYHKIVPDEDRAVNYETLATKYPIVDWESQIIGSYLQGNDSSYWKITRADGSSKFYKVFSIMLEYFDRQDLVDLHRLVKEMSASRALEGYDLILWGDLKTMFEPSEEDDVWRNQQD
ncbi:ribonuclease H-like domain-containing protein, partial [Tanacetum coccineum]